MKQVALGVKRTGMLVAPQDAVIQLELGEFQNFVYAILDWSAPFAKRSAAIVDPQENLAELLAFFGEHGFMLSSVFLTHTHFDHIAGLPALAKSHPGIPIFVHEAEVHRLDGSDLNIRTSSDGQIVTTGSVEVRVLHTPGHSAGACCFLVMASPPRLLTGDTIFIGDCGRTDLETGSCTQMFESIQRLKKLPPETIVLPGHHYSQPATSSIANEIETSAPFKCANAAELERLR